MSERASLLVVFLCQNKCTSRPHPAAADAPAPNKNARDGPKRLLCGCTAALGANDKVGVADDVTDVGAGSRGPSCTGSGAAVPVSAEEEHSTGFVQHNTADRGHNKQGIVTFTIRPVSV